jgi:hypothetical protein
MFAVLHAAFTRTNAICTALSAAVILPMGYVSPSGLGPGRNRLEALADLDRARRV